MRWLALFALVPIAAFAFQAKPAKKQPAAKPSFSAHVAPYLKKYCLSCHTGEYAADKIDLSKIKTASDATKSLSIMKKAAKVSTNKSMPPKENAVQPTAAERKMFADWINAQKK